MASRTIPSVCGSVNSSAMRRAATPQLSRAAVCAPRRAGSCTRHQISSQDRADITASSAKPERQPKCWTSQASGVPVNSSPKPPTPMPTPDRKAKRSMGKWREMNMVQARKAGEQPTPISNWPTISQP
ncbi:MAG: hypothetical protein GAK34_01418 [Delftia tsuruhatensis]|nr:MAG: hypothetical protein GAK34_01418 [Delftia tsuruhatensis]